MSRRVFSVALDSPRYSETPTASATSAPRPTTVTAVIGYRSRLAWILTGGPSGSGVREPHRAGAAVRGETAGT